MHDNNEKVIEELNIIPERSHGLPMPHTGFLCFTMVFYDDFRDVLHADGSIPEEDDVMLSIYIDYEKAFEKRIPKSFSRTETLIISPEHERKSWLIVNLNKGALIRSQTVDLQHGKTISFSEDVYVPKLRDSVIKHFNFLYLRDLEGKELIEKCRTKGFRSIYSKKTAQPKT